MEQNDSQKIMVINCCNDICDEKLKNISNSSNDVDNVIQNPIENDSENLTLLSTSGNDDLIDNLIDSVVNDSTENFINNNQNNDNAFKSDIYIDEVNDNIGSDEINITKNIYFNENSVLNTSEPKIDKICQFPLGRIKTIIKSDPDVNIISSESVFLISKATVCVNFI